jgi:hypothetical protein
MPGILLGSWSIERQIYIRQSGLLHAVARGECTFEAKQNIPEHLEYAERGKLKIGDETSEIPFTRRFNYQFVSTRQMEVFFGDGPDTGKSYQSYHYESPDKWVAEDVHLCGSDNYEGIYEFSSENSFSLSTVIKGPAKDFLIITEYKRR